MAALTKICAEIRNYFCKEENRHVGDFKIVGGTITPFFDLKEGQYYRIVGSVYNDGVHLFGDAADILKDEEYHGGLWIMKVPNDFVTLAAEIDDWINKYSEKIKAPYNSESFGGYSYSKASGKNGGTISWVDAFETRLAAYRRPRA